MSLRRDDGQAHILAVAVAGIAAVTISGLLAAQERLLDAAHFDRALEAAAQAAGAVVADEHLALVNSWMAEGGDVAGWLDHERAFLADSSLAERALAAAQAIAVENRADGPAHVAVEDLGREVAVTVERGRTAKVTVQKTRCCRR